MSLFQTHRALYKTPDVSEAILVTVTPTASFTVGFNLTFTGAVFIDFKEGAGSEALTSGVEKTNLYEIADTYVIEITGDLENITSFVADNSNITFISGMKTGLLVNFDISSNLYAGNLSMVNAPVSAQFQVDTNTGLTGIDFATSGNGQLTNLRFQSCNITGILDLSNITVSGTLFGFSNPLMTGITFATSGNSVVNSMFLNSCNITGVLDLSNVPVSGTTTLSSNSLMTGIAFATSGNAQTTLSFQSCNITGVLDLSNVPMKGTMRAEFNSLLTGITFASSGNATLTGFRFQGCNITGVFDWSNLPISGAIFGASNSLMTDITFSAVSNGVISTFNLPSCALTNLDFTVFSSSTPNITLTSNSMSSTEHDNQLINLDTTAWTNGTLVIITGNTARTATSDTAYNNLIANGWSIT